jgi:hypothetical protein
MQIFMACRCKSDKMRRRMRLSENGNMTSDSNRPFVPLEGKFEDGM